MPKTVDLDSLMTLAEAARQLGISRQSIHRAVKERRLQSIRVAGKPLVSIEAVRTYVPDPAHIELGNASKKARNRKGNLKK
jgi:excisionase family DNA binding protein